MKSILSLSYLKTIIHKLQQLYAYQILLIIQRCFIQMQATDSITRTSLNIFFVVSIIAEVLIITVFILLSALGYIGLDGGSPIAITSCENTYHTQKFISGSSTNKIITAAYIASICSVIAFSIVLAIVIKLMLAAKDSIEANIFVARCHVVTLYIFASLACLASVIVFGQYATFAIQMNKCGATYSNDHILALAVITGVLFGAALAAWILLFIYFKNSQDDKYQQLQNALTQPYQKPAQTQYYNKKKTLEKEDMRKQPAIYEKQPPNQYERKSPPKRIYQELEQTKENLNNSPSRQPVITSYSKQPQPQSYSKIPERRYEPMREPERSPAINQPNNDIRSYKKQPEARNISPTRGYAKQPVKNGEVFFAKSRNNMPNQDDAEFSKQQSRYLSKNGGRSILPSSGVQQKFDSNSFSPSQMPKRTDQNISRRKNGQGGILNLIRGKYAQ